MSSFAEGAAAIGIGVRKNPPPPSGLLEGLSSEPRERAALVELGTLDLMRRAGTETEVVAPLDPCPPETRRVARSADALAQAFALKAELAVLEWADAAARAGFIAPPEALSLLLGLPRASRERIRPVLGERGLWLAGLMGVDVDEKAGGEPDAERTVLREEFDALDYRELVRTVAIVAATAVPEDESLLMRAFGDRRKEVREAAVEGLVRLPNSPPARELRTIVGRTIVVHRGLLRRSFEIVPPGPDTLPEWLPKGTGRPGLGPLALALLDLARRVPPGVWEEASRMRPSELLEAASKTDYAEALLEGWQAAALRFGDGAWTDGLFRQGGVPIRNELVPKVAESVFDAVMIERLRDPKTPDLGALALRQRPFSPRLSQALIEAARTAKGHPYAFIGLGFALDLSVLPLLQEPWGEQSSPETIRLQWHTILELRARLLDSLR